MGRAGFTDTVTSGSPLGRNGTCICIHLRETTGSTARRNCFAFSTNGWIVEFAADGPYFFADLQGMTDSKERAAIEAGTIQAGAGRLGRQPAVTAHARRGLTQLEPVLGAAEETADVVAVQEDDRGSSHSREHEHGPRIADRRDEHDERERSHDRRQRGVPRQDEDDEPDGHAAEGGKRGKGEERAPGGGDHLPALLEPQEYRPRMPDHRRGTRQYADQRAPGQQPDKGGREALAEVEKGDRDPQPASVDPEHVGRADVPAAARADVLVPE